jgi:magnesium-transporting ATPase (P-type)
MRFRRCSIGGRIYGDVSGAVPLRAVRDAVVSSRGKEEMEEEEAVCEFVRVLALCHTVVVTDGAGEGERHMHSESPDEEALVRAAGELGWTFVGRESGGAEEVGERVKGKGKGKGKEERERPGSRGRRVVLLSQEREESVYPVRFELLATIPFDSSRKRMSVIVRRVRSSSERRSGTAARRLHRVEEEKEEDPEEIVLLCKGADNVMLDRCASFSHSSPSSSSSRSSEGESFAWAERLQARKDELMRQLNGFASDGLRTLVIGKRRLSTAEYEAFSRQWLQAETAITDREVLFAEAAAMVERDLCILGYESFLPWLG